MFCRKLHLLTEGLLAVTLCYKTLLEESAWLVLFRLINDLGGGWVF